MGKRECQAWDKGDFTFALTTLRGNLVLLLQDSEGNEISHAANVESTATCADNTSIVLRGSQSTVGATNRPNLQEDRLRNPDKQGPIKKTPSSVKKMISAFESGSAEDMRPQIKPPPIQIRSNKIKTGALLESHNLEEHKNVTSTESVQSISKAVVNPFRSTLIIQQNIGPTSGEKSDEQICLPGALDAIKYSHPTGIKNTFKQLDIHQVVDRKKGNFPNDFVRPSTFETVQESDKVLGKHRHEPCDMPPGKRLSVGIHGIEESRVQVSSRNSQITDVQEASPSANACTSEANLEDRHVRGDSGPNVCTSAAKCEYRHDPFERSGAWIFPDEAIRFCITTSGTNMMDSRGGCRENPSIHQQKMIFSLP
ncbi:hypothetical protein C1H46_029990 [Malus baccata]|uniref:Uncharacterized protein n=1 Tax=Malus baccata TaxID=106549 RepID=A0A540LDM8_MALBA|nr:hypothetical protein C1H46_029990 [Malus baccata]